MIFGIQILHQMDRKYLRLAKVRSRIGLQIMAALDGVCERDAPIQRVGAWLGIDR